ncbi:hypothetical protein ZIOFF_064115 [Zingiber officinale]|uniref:ARM repeat superfamily protein n=1 Tax=Zingiber officinale TaxID=94328 RepID=A0A8J5CFD3_ZINOF|nr:hypothetical protein ZIOFF_064115 [Zingiber officinale]
MIAYLGELVLSNDVKVLVAQTAGSILVNVMKSGSKQARETALKALNQISSYETSAKILIHAGILPPLVRDLFTVGINQLAAYETERDIVHSLLHLIRNTGPAIECKLLQVLVGLTSSSATVLNIVVATKSSGATISIIQFDEAPQRDVKVASIKLLNNISPFMGQELSDALRETAGQLNSLINIIADDSGISKEQAAAVGLLADLLESDSILTRCLLDEGAFRIAISKVTSTKQG